MNKRRLSLLLVLTLTPSLSHAVEGAFSAIQSVYSFSCNVSLGQSLSMRKQAVGAMLAYDFTPIRAHHEKLNRMSDQEFSLYMADEIRKVAVCHPVASGLVSVLPGTDYLAPLNRLASLPGSVDRTTTYAIWAYNTLYRSLNRYIADMVSTIRPLSPKETKADLASAKRLAERLSGLDPDAIVEGAGGVELAKWQRIEGRGTAEEGDEDGNLSGLAGALRPTIPVYALVGRDLFVYEVETVHLFFPSSVGASRHCYKRFAPDYPPFAQLINAGKATKIGVSTLSPEEAAELLKFYNAAAGGQAHGFLLSDLAAISMNDSSDASSLASCLSLASKARKPAELEGWEHGSSVLFKADDKLWQAVITMLAAKRILMMRM